MMEDKPTTPASRRRSGLLAHQTSSERQRTSPQLYNGNEKAISEELDRRQSSDSEMEMRDLLAEEGIAAEVHESDDAEHNDHDRYGEEAGFTRGERKRWRWRKQRNTRLDMRVAGESDVKRVQDKIVKATMLRTYLINALLIGLWYTFSIAISVYNKWMFSEENLHFPFPLFTTSAHMLVQFSLATAVLYFLPQFRPQTKSSDPQAQGYAHVNDDEGEPSALQQKPDQQQMTKWFYLTRIGPCGTATALDIGLGNFSLRFIRLTFFTMCKSSVLAFVLLFAFLFRLEKPSWKLGGVISLMTVGVIMMVAGEASFNAAGFVLVMSASFCSGFRWSLTQILLLRNPATSNPFSSIFFLTPVMFIALLILAIPIEGPQQLVVGFQKLAEVKGTALGIVIMLCPGGLAFMMVAAEFALLKRTSVVTLSVCGIFKEVLTISTAAKTFGDELSPINISGLVVTIVAIAAYNYLKYTTMRKTIRKQAEETISQELANLPPRPSSRQKEESSTSGRSTAELIRDSLTIATATNGENARVKANGNIGKAPTQSPVKRPEDIE